MEVHNRKGTHCEDSTGVIYLEVVEGCGYPFKYAEGDGGEGPRDVRGQ